MADQRTTVTRREIEAIIVARCARDEAFRAAFTSDPAGTLAAHLGVTPSQLPPMVVHEEPRGTWHLVVPGPVGTLSEEQLDGVAGGNAFPTQTYTQEYDGMADFPQYPLDLLVDLNALKGVK